MSGAGTAGLQQQDTQQKLQGSLYNAEQLAELNSQLEVIKAGSIAKQNYALQNQQADNMQARLDAYRAAKAQAAQVNAAPSQQSNSAALPSAEPAIPDAAKDGSFSTLPPLPSPPLVAQNDQKSLPPIPNPRSYQGDLPKKFAAPTGFSLNPVAASSAIPVPPAVSGQNTAPAATKSSASPSFWTPDPELLMEAKIADLRNPGMEIGKTMIANAAPDALSKSLIARNVAPGSDEWNAAHLAHEQKENYIAPTSLRGTTYSDQNGIHSLPGAAPEGYMNSLASDGTWSVVPVKGGLDAVAGEETAKTGAKTVATNNAAAWNDQQARARQAPNNLALIGTMAPLLDQFTSGNGAENLARWKSFASTHGIPVDTNATDAAQEFKKYSSQMIAQQRAAMGGSGSDQAQAMQEAGSANMGIGNNPNRNILQYMAANEKGILAFTAAKNNYLQATGNNMGSASNFDNAFNQVYDPRIIMYQDMAPAQKAQFVHNLEANGQADTFEQKLAGYTNLMRQYK